jgi:putative transposase
MGSFCYNKKPVPQICTGRKITTMKDYIRNQRKSRSNATRQFNQRIRRLKRENKRQMNYLLDETSIKGTQNAINNTLELERDDFLGRDNYQRVDDPAFRGYRNGYSQRTVGLGCGQVSIDMPRVSDSPEPFESTILPPYLRTSQKVLDTLPQLYLYGISGGDFRPALKVLLGEKAVLSDSSVTRLRHYFYEQYFGFHNQPLDSHYAYVYADGVYLKVGLSCDSLGILVIVGVNEKGEKRLLAMLPGYRESYENWRDAFRNLLERGVRWIGLIIGDGIPGLWRAANEVFPEALNQRDWMHKVRNVLEKLPRDKRLQARAYDDLLKIYNAQTREEANKGFLRFAKKYETYTTAVACLLKDRKVLTTYFSFPKEHWVHIKTTNPAESPFAPIRERLNKAKRLMNEVSALGLVYQLMLKRQARWRRLNYPELAVAVITGVKYRNGIEIKTSRRIA